MTTIIVGGGWSGLAAAITLIQQGQQVHLIESAKQLGGRARNIEWQGQTLDNGQHLMIGAYRQLLSMMTEIGIDLDTVFHRTVMDITVYDTDYPPLKLSAKGRLPNNISLAWHLIQSAGFKGLYQVVKLQSSIKKILLNKDISVSEWLHNTQQSPRLIKQLWQPLCLASLNTDIDEASAHLLAKVLQDSLGGKASDADLLIPRVPLGDLFPTAAANYIQQLGGTIQLQTRAKQLLITDDKVQGVITQKGDTLLADNIIIATSPSQYADLLPDSNPVYKPKEYPIYTVYLQYDPATRLGVPMVGMSGTLCQWLFDRSEQTPGLMAVVISAKGQHETMTKEALIAQVSQEIYQLIPTMPKHGFIIKEKRATFACTVDIEQYRPTNKTTIDGLWLAGDFVANGYPATLEGAIRNGKHCAQAIFNQVNSVIIA